MEPPPSAELVSSAGARAGNVNDEAAGSSWRAPPASSSPAAAADPSAARETSTARKSVSVVREPMPNLTACGSLSTRSASAGPPAQSQPPTQRSPSGRALPTISNGPDTHEYPREALAYPVAPLRDLLSRLREGGGVASGERAPAAARSGRRSCSRGGGGPRAQRAKGGAGPVRSSKAAATAASSSHRGPAGGGARAVPRAAPADSAVAASLVRRTGGPDADHQLAEDGRLYVVESADGAGVRRVGDAADPTGAAADYRERLMDMLHAIDFAAAEWVLTGGGVGGGEVDRCQRFLAVAAHDGQRLSVVDVHALLLLFTPTGARLQEAEDFLWTECNHRTSLDLADLARFGERLRERLEEYSRFIHLDDAARLATTYARVCPDEPLPAGDTDRAWRRLLAVVTAVGSGAKPPGAARCPRVYEAAFLADYCESLWRSGVVDRAEAVAVSRAVGSDLCGDLERYRADARAAAGAATTAVVAATDDQVVDYTDTATGWSGESPARKAGAGGRTRKAAAAPAPGRRTPSRGRQVGTVQLSKKDATKMSVGSGSFGQRSASHQPARSSSRRRPSFNLERQPKESTIKYLGGDIEADYLNRVKQDTRLIYKLQASYL